MKHKGASLVAQLVKNPPEMQETPVQFLDQEVPLKKQRSSVGYSPLGHKELDTTERLSRKRQ